MAIQSSYQAINPRLKTHYAIYTSAITGLVMLLIIFEQLGFDRFWLSHVMIAVPILFVLAIGVMAFTREPDEFYISGRRVPAAFNGFTLVTAGFGSVGLLSLTGTLFFIGFDALSLVLGWTGGFVIMALLFMPYLRKAGAFTMPGYLALRFDSQLLRIAAIPVLLVPLFLILIAELKIGAFAASLVIELPRETLIWSAAIIVILTVIWGGVRGLTWTQCAQFILVLLGVLVPLAILAVQLTNLPFPQLTYGTLLDDLKQLELSSGLAAEATTTMSDALPLAKPTSLHKTFLQPFASISQLDFLALTLSVMFGIAALPSLLARAGTTTNVHAARNAAGWGLFLLGILLISAPAYAVFAKYITLRGLIGQPIDLAPEWTRELINNGLLILTDRNQDSRLELSDLSFARDGVLFLLPMAAEFPFILIMLTISAAIAAALAASAAHTTAIAAMVSDDLYHCILFRSASPSNRLTAGRVALIVTALAAAWLAISNEFDSLRLFAWALSIFASALFPVLLLSIWWKRCNTAGALAGLLTGFGTAAGYIYLTEILGQPQWFGVDNMVAAVFGTPAAFLATLIVSSITPAAPKHVGDLADEMMIPGGEAIFDRVRRAAARRRAVG